MKDMKWLRRLHQEESGQDLLEYAMVLAAVLVAVITGSSTIAGDISSGLTSINTVISGEIAKVS